MQPRATNVASEDDDRQLLNQLVRNLDGPTLAPEQLLPLMKEEAGWRLFEELLHQWKRACEHGPCPNLHITNSSWGTPTSTSTGQLRPSNTSSAAGTYMRNSGSQRKQHGLISAEPKRWN